MNPQIRVSDETLNRLKVCAEPFVDKEPEDVIRRLLDEHVHRNDGGPHVVPRPRRATVTRVPRERGVIVHIEGHQIQAASVRDLYEQALKFLIGDLKADLRRFCPFKTSSARYLLADEPIHPGGNRFVVPVEYRGYFMEAHKNYNDALAHLHLLLEKLGLQFKY